MKISNFSFKAICVMSLLWFTSVGVTAVAATTGPVAIKMVKQTFVNPHRFYTMKISYPVIPAANGQEFNAEIKKVLADLKYKFTKDLQTPQQLQSNSSNQVVGKDSNELIISYKVMYNQNNRVSLRFSYFMSYFMSAHPVSLYRTVNYDLMQNKVLSLADMFKPNANYLEVLSNYCQQQLQATLLKDNTSDAEQIRQGTSPEDNNYQLWNLTPNGLLISFDVYTVASGVAGPQQVLVPNKVLKEIQL